MSYSSLSWCYLYPPERYILSILNRVYHFVRIPSNTPLRYNACYAKVCNIIWLLNMSISQLEVSWINHTWIGLDCCSFFFAFAVSENRVAEGANSGSQSERVLIEIGLPPRPVPLALSLSNYLSAPFSISVPLGSSRVPYKRPRESTINQSGLVLLFQLNHRQFFQTVSLLRPPKTDGVGPRPSGPLLCRGKTWVNKPGQSIKRKGLTQRAGHLIKATSLLRPRGRFIFLNPSTRRV